VKRAKNSQFKSGSGCYSCDACKRQTRESGSGESNCRLCFECFERCSYENQMADEGESPALLAEVEALAAAANAKGGSVVLDFWWR
jgi:hypothetical protein